MLVKKAIRKTKVFFHKTIKSLNSFLNREHHKLSKSPSLHLNHPNSARFFEDISKQSEPKSDDTMIKSLSTTMFTKETFNEKNFHFESFKNGDEKSFHFESFKNGDEKSFHFESFKNGDEKSVTKNKHDEKEIKREKKAGSYREDKGELCSKIDRGGSYVFARKMKEIQKMEKSDIDQVLDIEEVLHYYSCLTSPCYLDIVDKFYIDMHSEFLHPLPSKNISNSSRRLGPLKI